MTDRGDTVGRLYLSDDGKRKRKTSESTRKKPLLSGRFSGRLECKEDERRLPDECRLLGPLLGGGQNKTDKDECNRSTLARIVRAIAKGEIRKHLINLNQQIEMLAAKVNYLEWKLAAQGIPIDYSQLNLSLGSSIKQEQGTNQPQSSTQQFDNSNVQFGGNNRQATGTNVQPQVVVLAADPSSIQLIKQQLTSSQNTNRQQFGPVNDTQQDGINRTIQQLAQPVHHHPLHQAQMPGQNPTMVNQNNSLSQQVQATIATVPDSQQNHNCVINTATDPVQIPSGNQPSYNSQVPQDILSNTIFDCNMKDINIQNMVKQKPQAPELSFLGGGHNFSQRFAGVPSHRDGPVGMSEPSTAQSNNCIQSQILLDQSQLYNQQYNAQQPQSSQPLSQQQLQFLQELVNVCGQNAQNYSSDTSQQQPRQAQHIAQQATPQASQQLINESIQLLRQQSNQQGNYQGNSQSSVVNNSSAEPSSQDKQLPSGQSQDIVLDVAQLRQLLKQYS